MLIDEERFAPLPEDEEHEQPLSQAELMGGAFDPQDGLLVASCGEFFGGGALHTDRFMGATVAGRLLRQGLTSSGVLRRWYVISETSEPVTLDRQVDAVAREHRVPMPMYWRIPADEAHILCHLQIIHAFVSTGLANPKNLLFRAVTQTAAPNMAFVHSIPDQTAELLHLLAGQTFPFDVLVSPSQCGKRVLQTHLDRMQESLGIRAFEGDIAVIPHGIAASPLPARDAARARFGWNERVLLLMQRFDPDYKADLGPLLVALTALPDVRLVLAGADDGTYSARLESLAQELGVAARVELRPNILETTKRELLAGADVFLAIADNVQETHGLSVLEAMAAGLPVIATAWDGFRETVADTGILIPTAWHPPAASIAATSALTLGSGRPLSLQAQHVRFDVDAFIHAVQTLTVERARTLGAAARARAQSDFDVNKNAKQAAELLRSRVNDARSSKLAWRPHLGADWLRNYGHYADGLPTAVPARSNKLGEQRFAAIDRGLRKRMRQVLERMQVLAAGQDAAALVDVLCAEFPMLAKEGIERLVFAALKHHL